ncbi:hypothetical protein FGG08_005370 [Glutinoglossum americanum]|uniref:Deacetylase sirtuin-type domain-containing protein n=1 Tax=Glutinoglossum americanum TaxID=1670608 RepID=A0A9P8I0F3_9PEZI|nr:hypothetical protein FGG08_005370 [Glutinoglossum americanum]
MASSFPALSTADLESFSKHLQSSHRILALLGAGLSASSGLPTFRGAGGLWRSHDAVALATPGAFDADPGLVWQFYSYRRHMATLAKPNRAHYALAELARRKEGFVTLSQNVDGLSQRANHPESQLHLLHGSLFDVKCTSFYCTYSGKNFNDPIVPALAIPRGRPEPKPASDEQDATDSLYAAMGNNMRPDDTDSASAELDIADERTSLPGIPLHDLPHCPACKTGLLRPGVVWFGEMLPEATVDAIEDWIISSPTIDLIVVIGTSSKVYPAAGYTDRAREKGARVAVVNVDRGDAPGSGLTERDWFFEGDAGTIVPEILKSVIGEIEVPSN